MQPTHRGDRPTLFALLGACLALGLGCDALPGPTGPVGPSGPAGRPGEEGDAGISGIAGYTPPALGAVIGSVRDEASGDPIADAEVAFSPGSSVVHTAPGGGFSADLSLGLYTITISAAGFESAVVPEVAVVVGATVEVAAQLSPLATLALSVGPDRHWVGFGAEVALSADVTGASEPVVAWTQRSGPEVALDDPSSLSPTFTTRTLLETWQAAGRELPDRPGLLPLSPEVQGRYVFSVEVTDGPWSLSGEVTVTCAGVGNGRPSVARSTTQYVLGPEQDEYAWSLVPPTGSSTALQDADSRIPRFTPDYAGQYHLTESAGAEPYALTVWAGDWFGMLWRWGEPYEYEVEFGDWSGSLTVYQLCRDCHSGEDAPDKFTPWTATAHASSLARLLDAEGGEPLAPSCLTCHAVGYQPGLDNGGFDDIAADLGWTPPVPAEGTWADFQSGQNALARLANVQCESCHGPQAYAGHLNGNPNGWGGPRVSSSAEVCARCHDRLPDLPHVQEWRGSPHGDLDLARSTATVEARGAGAADCAPCHSSQGFQQYAGQLEAGDGGPLRCVGPVDPDPHACSAEDPWDLEFLGLRELTWAEVEPPNCSACHDPHRGDNDAQLRVFGAVEQLPAGFGVPAGVGAGATCMACHNSAAGARGDEVGPPDDHAAPHAGPQADILLGRSGYFVDGFAVSLHLAVGDTCVGCHVRAASQAGGAGHSFEIEPSVCPICHTPVTSAAAVQGPVATSLTALSEALSTALLTGTLEPALAGAGVLVRPVEPGSGQPSAAMLALPDLPLVAIPGRLGTRLAFTMELPSPLAVTWSDGSTSIEAALNVPLEDLLDPASGAPLVPADSPLVRAAWNHQLVAQDGSLGVHNPPFVTGLLDGALVALGDL